MNRSSPCGQQNIICMNMSNLETVTSLSKTRHQKHVFAQIDSLQRALHKLHKSEDQQQTDQPRKTMYYLLGIVPLRCVEGPASRSAVARWSNERRTSRVKNNNVLNINKTSFLQTNWWSGSRDCRHQRHKWFDSTLLYLIYLCGPGPGCDYPSAAAGTFPAYGLWGPEVLAPAQQAESKGRAETCWNVE